MVLWRIQELDGAIDTVPLGGLVANDIYLSQVQQMHNPKPQSSIPDQKPVFCEHQSRVGGPPSEVA